MAVSRTIGQIHFEDLEPHRFEDLSRQLVYDLRDWIKLEPTGRLGSDDGFDIRALEKAKYGSDIDEDAEPDENSSVPEENSRNWLIQCKREKRIGPKDISNIFSTIPAASFSGLYGFILIAACDFSKKARDAFYAECRGKNLQEGIILGKADLEDMLFQPKNDHLLFAYFGISLQIRKKSKKSELASLLAIKRKAVKLFGRFDSRVDSPILTRDIEDKTYPYIEDPKAFWKLPKWRIYRVVGYNHEGIEVLIRKFPAYFDLETERFDFSDKINELVRDDPWEKTRTKNEKAIVEKTWEFWRAIPEKNQAYVSIEKTLPYHHIVLIDEIGDPICKYPHIFCQYDKKWGPCFSTYQIRIEPLNRFAIFRGDEEKRIKYFPEEIRSNV